MKPSSVVHIIYGPQGAGKTTFARLLAHQTNAVRFSIDEWMTGLFGADLPQTLSLEWVAARVQRCETQIWQVSSDILARGGTVVLDLGLLRQHDRTRLVELARAQGVQASLHFIDAPLELRKRRVFNRNLEQGETFSLHVSPAMFDIMEGIYQAPDAAELAISSQKDNV
jgi:predicted kinase